VVAVGQQRKLNFDSNAERIWDSIIINGERKGQGKAQSERERERRRGRKSQLKTKGIPQSPYTHISGYDPFDLIRALVYRDTVRE
jgi:hypothetical protein